VIADRVTAQSSDGTVDTPDWWGVCPAVGVPIAEPILVGDGAVGIADELHRQGQVLRARTRPAVYSAELWTGARLFYDGRAWLVRWGAEPDPPSFVYAARVWGVHRAIDAGGQDGARRLTLQPSPSDGTELVVVKADVDSLDGGALGALVWTPVTGVRRNVQVPEGFRPLEALERQLSRRGKRKGDGRVWDTPEEFTAELAAKVAEYEGAIGRPLQSKDRERIEYKLGVGKTTLYDRLHEAFGLSWGEFVRQRPDLLPDLGGIKRNRTAG
jgi:hypothetical protein